MEESAYQRHKYSEEIKLAAVRSFVDDGLTMKEVVEKYEIASRSTLKKWIIGYRREGKEALAEKPRGRKPGSKLIRRTSLGETEVLRAEIRRLSTKLGESDSRSVLLR